MRLPSRSASERESFTLEPRKHEEHIAESAPEASPESCQCRAFVHVMGMCRTLLLREGGLPAARARRIRNATLAARTLIARIDTAGRSIPSGRSSSPTTQ